MTRNGNFSSQVTNLAGLFFLFNYSKLLKPIILTYITRIFCGETENIFNNIYRCEVDIDECLPQPCQNGATCVDWVNNYTCVCQPGYEGRNCSQEIDECASNPCMGGATCRDQINDFVCICPPGLTGKTCSINIDDCEVLFFLIILLNTTAEN